ncbi:hypothetical protein [Pelagibacterium halotolerans]|uniref:Uncharacterized protein n=1 Tax=Pelagibacterium halotolerans (strain DSM 22347 / JCM 15775 / CGMCC 1.7692 / B2) TaxID=1082931 RepID=G4RFU6_PELHB|nr:hypothetical protein [Pelagibacterium halotolerans]AEQ50989.1 hypothetical protein KKY_953 [Pelagibacterium halotolerans B2]QJR19118.1 hypothetical protein HKM20_12125 [Pelagibacterium halotolerans]SEA01920.1 hypothetical protein SAMN05428936_101877 [Pelagibacterium halotolerans]
MQHKNPDNAVLATVMAEVVEAIEAALKRTNDRISALEKSGGFTVLDDIDFSITPAPNTFAKYRGGLWRFADGEWRVVANGIETVQIEETPAGAKLTLEKSDGGRVHQNLTFSKH